MRRLIFALAAVCGLATLSSGTQTAEARPIRGGISFGFPGYYAAPVYQPYYYTPTYYNYAPYSYYSYPAYTPYVYPYAAYPAPVYGYGPSTSVFFRF